MSHHHEFKTKVDEATKDFDLKNYQDWKVQAGASPSEAFRQGVEAARQIIINEAEKLAEIGFNCRTIKLDALKKFVGEDQE